MQFDSKAKTTRQILNAYWNIPADSTHKQYVTILKKKWVPLEVAEKRVQSFIDEDEKLFTSAYAKVIDLESRIAEANKILDIAELVAGGYKITGVNWLALRDTLKQPEGIKTFLTLENLRLNRHKEMKI
jgi:hypothetical protein